MNSTNTDNPLNRRRIFIFKVVTILLPFVLLALTEGILRLSGYGENMHLFQEYPEDSSYWVMNRSVSLKYFTLEENAQTGFTDLFAREKAPETFRIFILGGSTGIGDPYTQLISYGRWLQYRLMRTFPETRFEVVNLCLTAVNSYTVFDFAREIVHYEPDAVLIYAGHNEYYGALGVGSTSKLGNRVHLVRTLMALRQLRLVQLINNGMSKLTRGFKGKDATSDEGLMQRMAAGNEIPYQSKKFQRGIRQFEVNMDDACSILAKAGIPVFLSNLVSNEKDLEPFISESGNIDRSAADQFDLAKKAYEDKDYALAKELFIKAKDLDMLRFRAPEDINDVIARLADAYDNVYPVDCKSLFEAYAPHDIIGNETIIDHLHPNLLGYALMSEAFYNAMKEQGIIDLQGRTEISFDRLLDEMPVNRLDSLKGVYANEYLMQRWPFQEIPAGDIVPENSVEGQLAYDITFGKKNWFNAVLELSAHYVGTGDWGKAYKLAEAGVLELPYVPDAYMAAYQMGIEAGDPRGAAFYLGKAWQLVPDQEKAENMFGLLVAIDQPEKTLPYLEYLINNTRQGANYIPSRTFVNEIADLKASYAKDSSDIGLLNRIADNYIRLGNRDVALQYVNRALSLEPGNRSSLEMYNRIMFLQ